MLKHQHGTWYFSNMFQGHFKLLCMSGACFQAFFFCLCLHECSLV